MARYIGKRYRVILDGTGHVLKDGFLDEIDARRYANSTIFNHWHVEEYDEFQFEHAYELLS